MNRVFLSGRPTDDPDIRYTADKEPVANFTIAVDGFKDHTDFIRCKAFKKQAEFIQMYIHKGMKILVEGRWQTGSYDGQNGKVYTNDCIIDRIEFMEKKNDSPKAAPKEAPKPKDPDEFVPVGIDEDLPFM